MNYYNEFDPKAAAWLEELIKEGHIPNGWVDTRSINDVRPHELLPYTQHHFFAGIGGWCLALRLAGWPEAQPVRTGSCPCQPFSTAGRGLGTKDPRHLWPVFRDLITFGVPAIAFGEQVASSLGKEWMQDVRADLEGIGYEVGAAILPAASVGAPMQRKRFFWMANPASKRGRGRPALEKWDGEELGGPGANLRFGPWPDGRGGGSTLAVSEILAPSHGLPGRMGLLRGYGNAIVPELAAVFIRSAVEAINPARS
jgi:DNA (cytosine-5)-methyltransferase 1